MSDQVTFIHPVDSVLHIKLNRPEKLNALTAEILDQLISAAHNCELQGIRCVILSGDQRAFSAGGDIVSILEKSTTELEAYLYKYAELDDAISKSDAVWIAAVEGLAYGGGMEIASMCDLRIASKGATFCVADIEVGALPTGGLTWLLPRLIGPTKATSMILANEVIVADEAMRIGFVTEVIDSSTIDRAIEIARKLIAFDPQALVANRRAIRESMHNSKGQAQDFEVNKSIELLRTNAIRQPLINRFLK